MSHVEVDAAAFAERYELIEELGRGSFGRVMRARQRVTGQDVAVKFLQLREGVGASTPQRQIARFQREMKLCARLQHPNIVRLLDSGRTDAQTLYTVFEFVPGQSLAELIAAEGALAPREALRLMIQVLDALGAAHKSQVIHRDIKPHNIMVQATGVRRNARVLDFGLGLFTGQSDDEDLARLTGTHDTLGTPAYAAPEELRGQPVAPNADLYAWGLVLLECLTGERPMSGTDLTEVLYKQLGPEPVPVPASLRAHPLGPILEAVVSKDPADRRYTAVTLYQALDGVLTSEAALADLGDLAQESLDGAAAKSDPAASTWEAPSAERRQLTALCCHLATPTSAEGSLDDFDAHLRERVELIREVAADFEGHVAAVLGETVLIYFGFPRVREGDARRAVRAAYRLIAELEAFGEDEGVELAPRIGVHTGEVVLDASSLDRGGSLAITGATPHLAVHLGRLAPVGGIAVSAQSRRLLEGWYRFEPRALEESGSMTISRAWLVAGAGEAESRLITRETPVRPLAGRTAELGSMEARWAEARAGRGQVILIRGEAGIGKSRLAWELTERRGAERSLVLESRCTQEARTSALRPVLDTLELLVGLEPQQSMEARGGLLQAFLERLGPDLAPGRTMPLFAPLLGASLGRHPALHAAPAKHKELALDALARLFLALATRQPLLWLVEDLHWADPTSLDFLTRFAQRIEAAPVCLVATARPEYEQTISSGQALDLRLEGLDREAIAAMTAGLLDGRALPAAVLDTIVERTDGISLFVEELTTTILESGILELQGDQYVLVGELADLSIPTTLRDSLAERLERVGPARFTAQLAAAIGREFDADLLVAVSARDAAALEADLDALMEADLVHRRRRLRRVTYLFKHALIRDAAYASLTADAGRQVHGRIAAVLEESFPRVVERRPDLLAMHHAAADQRTQALGYAQKAGMAALMRSDNAEAVNQATQALPWLEAVQDAGERAGLELGLNGILMPAYMSTVGWADERIRKTVDRNLALIEQLGDGLAVVPTLFGLVTWQHVRGLRADAQATARRMVAIAEEAGQSGNIVAALSLLGQVLVADAEFAEAIALSNKVLSLYDPGQHAAISASTGMDPRAYAYCNLAYALTLSGDPDGGLEAARAAVAWAREIDFAPDIGLSLLFLAATHQLRGEREAVISVADEILQLDAEFGLPGPSMYGTFLRCWAVGDADTALQMWGGAQFMSFRLGISYYPGLIVDLHRAAGRFAEGVELADGLIEGALADGDRWALPDLLRLRALCHEGLGHSDAAVADLEEAVALAEAHGAHLLAIKALTELAARRTEARSALEAALARIDGFADGVHVVAAREALAG